MQTFFGSIVSDEQGWLTVLVAFPLIGLALWGLNTFLLNRLKNGKKYRYFTCPKCKQRLRVPRGVGSVTITCKNCGTKFDKKA